MKKLAPEKLKPGMITAEPISTKRGQVIAPAGSILTSQIIARVSFYKITSVAVKDEIPTSSDVNEKLVAAEAAESDVIDEKGVAEMFADEPATLSQIKSYTQTLINSPEYKDFQTSYALNIAALKDAMIKIIVDNDTSNCATIVNKSSELFTTHTSLQIFDMVHTLQSMNDAIYSHSLNVALIARAIAKWMGYKREQLEIVTAAGLLHDIGKVKIDPAILNKKEKLTDEEFDTVRSHARLGFDILKRTNLSPHIKYAALQHHERADGSGYPRGLEMEEIDDVASIIAIADVYDAMISTRSWRPPMCPFQVIAHFEEEGYSKYDPEIIYTLMERLAGCYSSARVLLSDGRGGKVVYLNKKKLSRPIISMDDNTIVDLCDPTLSDIYIKAIL